jgi:hypothetical protein
MHKTPAESGKGGIAVRKGGIAVRKGGIAVRTRRRSD